MCPVKGELFVRGLCTEMALPRKQKDKLAGGQVVAVGAGLNVQLSSDYGNQFIGILGTSGVQELIVIGKVACPGKGNRPGGVGYKV